MSEKSISKDNIVINVDGACEPVNPGGIATYGFVVRDSSGKTLKEEKGVVDEGEGMTNNVAEYTAAIEAFKWIANNLDPSKVALQGDSQLLVRQITGEYRTRSSRIRPLNEELTEVIEGLDAEFEVKWVPREQNEGADALSKEAVDEYVQTHDYQIEGHPVVKCDKCGAWMVARRGKYGMFYGCSRYPKCKNTKSIEDVEKIE